MTRRRPLNFFSEYVIQISVLVFSVWNTWASRQPRLPHCLHQRLTTGWTRSVLRTAMRSSGTFPGSIT
jgi:hypothetical protein